MSRQQIVLLTVICGVMTNTIKMHPVYSRMVFINKNVVLQYSTSAEFSGMYRLSSFDCTVCVLLDVSWV